LGLWAELRLLTLAGDQAPCISSVLCASSAARVLSLHNALSLLMQCWCCAHHWCHVCLQSDATYLIVTDNGEIENFGLNAVCTHLGCVVPWNDVSVKHTSFERDDHNIQILQHPTECPVQAKGFTPNHIPAWACFRAVLEGLCCPIGAVATVAWTILQAK
jgi:hypothetical protein